MNITRPSHQSYNKAVELANNAKHLSDGKLAGAKYTGYNYYLANRRSTSTGVNNFAKKRVTLAMTKKGGTQRQHCIINMHYCLEENECFILLHILLYYTAMKH